MNRLRSAGRPIPFPLLSLLLPLATALSSPAAEHWVDSDDDIRSLVTAGTVQPGDTVIWRNGVYDGMEINFNFMGTESARITLRAETPGRVILKGSSFVKFGGDYLTATGLVFYNGDDYLRDVPSAAVQFRSNSGNRHAHYCRLTNCAIIDFNSWEQDVDDDDEDGDREEFIYANSKWIQIYGTNHRVDHCHFSKKIVRGALIITELVPQDGEEGTPYPSYNHRIDHNFFGPNPIGFSGNEFETIRLGTSDFSNFNGNMIVENNHFYHCDGEIETISNKSSHNTIRNNILIGCQGSIVSRHGDFTTLDGNVILGQGIANTGGIRINGEGHIVTNNYVADTMGDGLRGALVLRAAGSVSSADTNGGYEQVRNALIAHNTFVNNRQTWNLGELGSKDNSLGARNCRLVNNLAVGTTGPLISWGRAPQEMTYENNIVWGADAGLSHEGILNTDPELEDRPNALLSPGDSSPANDGGLAVASVGLDIDGQARSASTPDIGADEVSPNHSLLAPIAPTGVGPDWLPEGSPFDLKNIRLEENGVVALEYLRDNHFGYGFYGFEVSSDLKEWDAATPVSVDAILNENLRQTHVSDDPQTDRFWRLVFKSPTAE
ncbi:MAG: polysaccharide lyase 6 family protein [Verrucomicrobiaceae bacterium]